MAVAASGSGSALRGVFFLLPLAVEAAAGLLVECAVSEGHFDVRSGVALTDGQTHCSGGLATGEGWQRIDHALVRARSCARTVHACALYDGFDAVGLQYGPGYRTLERVWGGWDASVAHLRARATHEGTCVHPADLDDALCASAAIASGDGGDGTRLPFAVDDALLRGAQGWLWAVCAASPRARIHEPL